MTRTVTVEETGTEWATQRQLTRVEGAGCAWSTVGTDHTQASGARSDTQRNGQQAWQSGFG